jgi:hypothetical protein
MRADVVPGAVFPDYGLPDHRGYRPTPSSNGAGSSLLVQWHGMSIVPSYAIQLDVQWIIANDRIATPAVGLATNW